jgi:hypothetical protein
MSTLSRRGRVVGAVAGVLALAGVGLGTAEASQAATKFPNSGIYTCFDVSIRWSAPSSTQLTIVPVTAKGRAVMERYYGGKIVRYYGRWVNNNAGQHDGSTVKATTGTWVADYMEWGDAPNKGVMTKVYPNAVCRG